MDLGASIITGLVGNPVHVLLKQALGVRGLQFAQSRFVPPLHFIERHGLVFDQRGRPVERDMDQHVERDVFNRALAATNHFRHNAQHSTHEHEHAHADTQPHHAETELKAAAASSSQPSPSTASASAVPALDDGRVDDPAPLESDDPYASDRARLHLEGGLEQAERMSLLDGMSRALHALDIRMSDDERALYHWLVAELEYGCAAPLDAVSMTHWSDTHARTCTALPAAWTPTPPPPMLPVKRRGCSHHRRALGPAAVHLSASRVCGRVRCRDQDDSWGFFSGKHAMIQQGYVRAASELRTAALLRETLPALVDVSAFTRLLACCVCVVCG